MSLSDRRWKRNALPPNAIELSRPDPLGQRLARIYDTKQPRVAPISAAVRVGSSELLGLGKRRKILGRWSARLQAGALLLLRTCGDAKVVDERFRVMD